MLKSLKIAVFLKDSNEDCLKNKSNQLKKKEKNK
jgi:hypothetical protein